MLLVFANAFRHPEWLHRRRLVAWGLILLGVEAGFLIFVALWQHGAFFVIEKPTSSDFVSFYAAGKLALAGTPELAYDRAAHYIAEQKARVEGAPYQFFFYPPTFLVLCAALATLPYFVAYATFQLVTLSLFAWMLHRVLSDKDAGWSDWSWLAALLAFPAVFWTIGLGQNAFLTAALFGGFTLLVDKRPAASGVLLGLLCYKPHFGLLAPVALLAGKRWIAFAAAAATVGVSIGASVLLFGVGTWGAYLTALSGSGAVYTTGRIDHAGMITVFGGALLMGLESGWAFVLQAGAALVCAVLVAVVWRRNLSLPLRAATLLTATLLAAPLALLYDQLLTLVAMAWLLRAARSGGFLPWEKLTLAAIYPAVLVAWPIGASWRLPLGPMIGLAVLLLCLRRVRGPANVVAAPRQLATAEGANPLHCRPYT
jgi:alpha-1,2-mannosyltransferase